MSSPALPTIGSEWVSGRRPLVVIRRPESGGWGPNTGVGVTLGVTTGVTDGLTEGVTIGLADGDTDGEGVPPPPSQAVRRRRKVAAIGVRRVACMR
jgi:hypothetical protein